MPSSPSTPDRLLDAAELLFADNGYHGVPVRTITQAAGTRLAAINDHFGGKEKLFQAVVARRAGLINGDRERMLRQAEPVAQGADGLAPIVDAFARPLLTRSQESEGWRNYLRLTAQLSTTRSTVLLLIADQFDAIAQRFMATIGAAVPALDERQRGLAYQLMVASVMGVFSDNLRINVLTGNRFQSSDFKAHYADLIGYVTGGILGLAQARSEPPD
ncbi:TetR/AcrR family transcriptional regulator [Alloalcanivorax gelatiniphagus]|uniref:TetR/AcrR family transcriptional regulator n=1 Tax=Alloalcanivorax gelatiniphagus TaxID=1194167 RepID=A0ABY2XJ00_9GAMM|nr:TetR/AcrR family transcriptional regulator [Alloalcanivorax gelatiniphagus]TMW11057.1 TetR/AcrR family transcriptional regulator [Alloalcanivorax gelatiniphagus]